ncbi:hypothetical protein [Actinomadura gamaensis]|uniref:Exosortase/archaeosortase family protein n=1 Tax=Actinomadura gamaensis TaxID=1763541 RepID=A0ABV9TSN6_9ACTN
MPAPRLLLIVPATLATTLAAAGTGLTLHRVLPTNRFDWELTNDLRAVTVPFVLTAVFAAALLAAWTRRTTTSVLLSLTPAVTHIVRLVTSLSFPWSHFAVRYLYRYPLGGSDMVASDGGVTWAEATTMAAIGAGVVAAMAGVLASATRNRPRLLLVGLPVMVGLAAVANDIAQSLVPEKYLGVGWWGLPQHLSGTLIVLALGSALLLLARAPRVRRIRRGGAPVAALVQGAGAILLLFPLAQELWRIRPLFVRRLLGEHITQGIGIAEGFTPPRWEGIADALSSLAATTLQLTIVLAAVTAVTCVWPERREDGR